MALQVQALCILMRRSSPWMTRGPSASQRENHLASSSPIILPSIHFLQSLDLSKSQISDNHMKRLCEGLTGLTALQSLDVSGNKISDQGMVTFCQGLAGLTALQSLDVSGNQIGDKHMERLCQVLDGLTSLQSLDVRDNKISHVKFLPMLDEVYKNIVAYSQLSGHSDR
jgi:Leucine-rich repeat (LRR) protein